MNTSTTPRTIRLHASDNVVVAVDPIRPGTPLEGVTATALVSRGHKLAVAAIAPGEPVRKFGQVIGFASKPIAPGDWVHEHNVVMREDFERAFDCGVDALPEDVLPVGERATFEGFRRSDGRVGTRNYLGILTSVNCSASAARFIAEEIARSGVLADYPNIDGVIPLVHGGGCALDIKGEG
ncbi:MAG: UxaA family hydrolase, partial [Bradyrhizobiaceae bacterium]|nr:UxaA family hydrolase [Bradyrhizobiaceae bacterium]